MGTGSRVFRCGLVHSSGVIYLGTYGPKPAIVWKYDPKAGTLEKVGTPGEYQLDCMVEAPNGIIYIGTAYNGLVYRLDPRTGKIRSLGSPPIASTPWIFTMICTFSGEIYGAKGVGLFRLDWKSDKFESIGLVPGDHRTPGPNPSDPVVRQLTEVPDGTLFGDTNRWLFRFDPKTRTIKPLADMVAVDNACYALFLPAGYSRTDDCYFALYARFSDATVKNPFYVYRARDKLVEPVVIKGWTGTVVGGPDWQGAGRRVRTGRAGQGSLSV